jgi:hypothetical protein
MKNSINKSLTAKQESANNPLTTGVIMIVLNAVESAILSYKRRHPMIGNEYHWFAEQCGYKAKNYFYHLFEQRLNYELKWKDIEKVYEITKDEHLKSVVSL